MVKGGSEKPCAHCTGLRSTAAREPLNKSFDRLRTNGKLLIPFVVSLSNHEWTQLVQRFPKRTVLSALPALLGCLVMSAGAEPSEGEGKLFRKC